MRPDLAHVQLVHALLDEVRERGPFRTAVKRLAHEVRTLLDEPVVEFANDDGDTAAVSCPECHGYRGYRGGCPRCNYKGYVLAEAVGGSHLLYTAAEVGHYQATEADLVSKPLRAKLDELRGLLAAAGAVDERAKLSAQGDALPSEPVGWLPIVADADGDLWARDRDGWIVEGAESSYPRLSWRYLLEAHGPVTVIRPGYTAPADYEES